MGFYQDRILPYLVDLSMRQAQLVPYRTRALAAAGGRVLEIGVGSGMNLPLYTPETTSVVGLEPSAPLVSMAHRAAARSAVRVHLLEGSAEDIPLAKGSIDSVVTTWTLCSIPDVDRALQEMRRVLKPGGRLYFVEHGRSPDTGVRRWQDRLTPMWRRIAGGCHLNRPIDQLLAAAGFAIERLDLGYMRGPRPMTYMYEGRARSGGG